jgi:hypothetical protein
VIGIDGRASLAALPVVLALLLGIYFGHFRRKSTTTWIPWQSEHVRGLLVFDGKP